MQSRFEHLRLTEKLFRDTISHLQQKVHKLEALHDDDHNFDVVDEERVPACQSTITALRLEICLYSLCLDWVRQRVEEHDGIKDEARARARENFYRLMSALAQSELTRDARTRSFGLSSRETVERPLTDAQMFTALGGTAERQLASLIAL